MAILQVMSYDSYPFDSAKNFITHAQNGLERHLSGLHQMYFDRNYYLLINDYDQSLTLRSCDINGLILENYRLSLSMTNSFELQSSDELAEVLEQITQACEFELIHFHFQQPIVLEMVRWFKQKTQATLIHTMHDLSYACGSYYYVRDYQVTQKTVEAINVLDHIIFPDASVEAIYRGKMEIRVPTHVIPHGTDMEKIVVEPMSQELKVLFLGALNEAKGGLIVAGVTASSILNVSWHVLGRLETSGLKDNHNFVYHGEYTSDELEKKLQTIKPHLVVLPSQMIETFSYNLADCLAAGIPVIVPQQGAFLRIEGQNIGWFVEEQTVQSYLAVIKKIAGDTSEYQSVSASVRNYKQVSISGMNKNYQKLYHDAKKNIVQIKLELTQATVAFEKKQYQQLVHTHQAFVQEQKNAQQHLEAYGVLAEEHNKLGNAYSELAEIYQQQTKQLEKVETLLSKRILGRVNRYVLNKDDVSKK